MDSPLGKATPAAAKPLGREAGPLELWAAPVRLPGRAAQPPAWRAVRADLLLRVVEPLEPQLVLADPPPWAAQPPERRAARADLLPREAQPSERRAVPTDPPRREARPSEPRAARADLSQREDQPPERQGWASPGGRRDQGWVGAAARGWAARRRAPRSGGMAEPDGVVGPGEGAGRGEAVRAALRGLADRPRVPGLPPVRPRDPARGAPVGGADRSFGPRALPCAVPFGRRAQPNRARAIPRQHPVPTADPYRPALPEDRLEWFSTAAASASKESPWSSRPTTSPPTSPS